MGLGTPCIASDIPANRETGLSDNCYFPVGDTGALAMRLREFAAASSREREIIGAGLRATCMRYNWDEIAVSTMQVMKRAAGRAAPVQLQKTKPARPH
jgi:starch synthase